MAYVVDSHGHRTDFPNHGIKNTAFHGVVEETYRLYVETGGEMYESNAETIPVCPELDSVTAVYSREDFRDPNELYYDDFDVYARVKGVADQENYY